MPAEHIKQRRVEFSETDLAGIIHYSSYFQYMEEAEHEFFRSMGFSIKLHEDGASYGFPRISTLCEYSRPLEFEDVVDIQLRVFRVGETSITYQFLFSEGQAEVARGEVSVACVTRDESGRMSSCKLPASLAGKLSVYQGEPLTFGPGSDKG